MERTSQRINELQRLLSSVLECAEVEKRCILDDKSSQWSYTILQNVVIPEITELSVHAKNGTIYFRYGKKQRLLESSYYLTDALNDLCRTELGKEIMRLQQFYDQL